MRDYCDRLRQTERIAFDTEFVSETTYRPQLCLIQVADDDGRVAIIDPFAVDDLAPFWERLASEDHIVLAHAAREETRFCHRYSGRPIGRLFDTQLAAGFVGMEFPASLSTLVSKLVGKTLPKGETRTDWSRRPLTEGQMRYAISDVTELHAMHDRLSDELDRRERWEWLEEETGIRQQKVIDYDTRENWRRVSGSSGLKPRQLEIVRQLWLWREGVAKHLDRLPKRVLRDDLIVELARRGSSDVRVIRGIRGIERRLLSDRYEELSAAIETALQTPEDDLPQRPRGKRNTGSPMLAQFLSTSMACLSRQHDLAPSIVGNSDDVKQFLSYELSRPGQRESIDDVALARGWRGQIVAATLRDVLAGRVAIRVDDVRQEQPLEFVATT